MPDFSSGLSSRKAIGRLFAGCAAGLSLSVMAGTPAAGETAAQAAGVQAAAAFDQLKSLEGTWRVAGRQDHPLRIRFYPSAGGSTLVESWEVEGRSHSLTLYHRDGETLLATHYCPQGNQPRMALAGSAAGEVRFSFRDATDLEAGKEQHQHTLAFAMDQNDRIVRSEQYKDGEGAMHPSELVLVRVGGDKG